MDIRVYIFNREYLQLLRCTFVATKLPKNEGGAGGAAQSRAGGVQLSQGAEQESSGCCK